MASSLRRPVSSTFGVTGQTVERQRDTKTREVKCIVAGIALDGSAAEAVVKLGFTGKLFVITEYLG